MDAVGTHERCARCRGDHSGSAPTHRSALLGLLRSDGMRRALVWLPPVVLGAFALGVSLWTCPLVSATGCRCPGCGMTRAIGALGRGDLEASLALHPFAWGFALGWILLAAYELLGRRRAGFERLIARVETRVPLSSVFLGAFAVFGIARMFADAFGVGGHP